jgi:heat shock protein HslJ
MMRRLTALLATAALAFSACGEPGGAVTTTAPGGTVPPSTTAPGDGTAFPALSQWVVVSFGLDGADDPVLPNAVPTIDFDEDGLQIGGTTGCNSYFGSVALGPADAIAFGQLGMTEMACLDDGVMDQEQRFLEALSRIDRWVDDENGRRLEASDGSAAVSLTAAPAPPDLPLAGDWSLTTFIDGEAASSLLMDTEVTLTVDTETGILSGNGGCNSYSGTAALDIADDERSATIAMGPMASTEMACEPGIMVQEAKYLAALQDATTMIVDAGSLTISTDDGRALVFAPAAG